MRGWQMVDDGNPTQESPPKLPEYIPSPKFSGPDAYEVNECEQRYLAEKWSDPLAGRRIMRDTVSSNSVGTGKKKSERASELNWGDQRRELARRIIKPARDAKSPPADIESGSRNAARRAYNEFVFTGIGLSGGGIRSATFCLGILQALAAHDLLRHFDYLSTVSGGGYIGSSLRWWWRSLNAGAPGQGNAGGTGPHDFPYGTEDPERGQRAAEGGYQGSTSPEQAARLEYLRAHGNYLMPGNGIGFFSGIAAVTRTIFINLFVWIPISAAVFALMLIMSEKLNPWAKNLGLINPAAFVIKASWYPLSGPVDFLLPVLFALLLWLAILASALFLLFSIAYSLLSVHSHDTGWGKSWRGSHLFLPLALAVGGLGYFALSGADPVGATFSIMETVRNAAGLAAIAISFFVVSGLAVVWFKTNRMDEAYYMRRKFEMGFGWLFVPFLLCLAVGVIPIVTNSVRTAVSTGSFAVILGVIAAFRGQYAYARKLSPTLVDRIFLPLGGAMLLFGALICGYLFALTIISPQTVLGSYFSTSVKPILVTMIILALVLSVFSNVNQTGLHRFYRDRLMEAFMPDWQAVLEGRASATPDADQFKLYSTWYHRTGTDHSTQCSPTYGDLPAESDVMPVDLPYPIINTNVILINDVDRKVATRGGDNYVLSPIYCGSNATGWVRTQHSICRSLTLASAMAASGAAANSNSGYVGGGLTRNTLISIVMMFLNIRLGYWVPNPHDYDVKRSIFGRPNHWYPGFFYSVLREGYRRDSGFLELSDGGHFENLGLYELVRRRCRLSFATARQTSKQHIWHLSRRYGGLRRILELP
jgi:hypothetical protein